MKFTEEEIKDIEKSLLENNYFEADEHLVEFTLGDFYEFGFSQVRGRYYFSDRRIVFQGFGTDFNIKFADIQEVKPCLVGPFLPFGIKIKALDPVKNKVRSYKLSVLKRKVWIDFINEKVNVAKA